MALLPSFLISLCLLGVRADNLFGCHNLSNAHYNYLKPPGESVTMTCPRNCSAEGNTQWYHSYAKVKTDLRLLAWSGAVHEAAVTETPQHGSVGWFCCVCEEEDDKDSCCWGVAYQPAVNLTMTAMEGLTTAEETLSPVNKNVSLRCEVRGFPRIRASLTPPPGFNRSHCREAEKSWYSSVLLCYWPAFEADSGMFKCTGTILIDSRDNKKVEYNETASHQLSIYKPPSITRFYQATEVDAGLEIICEIECSPVIDCSVVWYYKGMALDTDSIKYVVSSEGGVYRLTVLDSGRGDLGRYSCLLRSRVNPNENSSTIIVTLPDGVEPTPEKVLPGPDRDEKSGRTTTWSALMVMGFMVMAAVVSIIIILIHRALSFRRKGGRVDLNMAVDSTELIHASAEDDNDEVVTDGVSSRRRISSRSRRSRPSYNKN